MSIDTLTGTTCTGGVSTVIGPTSTFMFWSELVFSGAAMFMSTVADSDSSFLRAVTINVPEYSSVGVPPIMNDQPSSIFSSPAGSVSGLVDHVTAS